MSIKSKLNPFIGLAVISILSGCSYGTVGTSENHVEASSVDAQRYLAQSRRPLVPENLDRIRVEEGVWTGSISRHNDHGNALPRQWEKNGSFEYSRGVPMQIFEIGTAITELTNIPVTFSPDVLNNTLPVQASSTPESPGSVGGRPQDINALLSGMGLGGASGALPTLASGNTSNIQNGQIRPVTGTRNSMRVDFKGRLSQFLNQMSAHFGVGWEYGSGEIRVFRNITRTYTVQALPSNIKLDSSLSSDSNTTGGTGGASSSAAQKITSSVNIQIWDDITKAVGGIVGSQGVTTTSVSTGTITVTAPSGVIERVQHYLDGQNERLSKQVTVGITILSVELKDGDNTSLDIGGLFNKVGEYGLAFGTPSGAARGGAGLASGLISALGQSSSPGGGVSLTINNPNSSFNGSNALIQALATKGRVSLKTTESVTTLNGVPAPVQVTNTRDYVKNITVSDATTTNGSTSAPKTGTQTSTVTTGFSSSILPRIDPDNSAVSLDYKITISELIGADNGFDHYVSGDGKTTTQLANVNSRNFSQQTRIPNGATLVLTSFEQTNDTANRTGSAGDPTFMGLGGSQVGQRHRTVIVILLTPTVVSSQAIVAE